MSIEKSIHEKIQDAEFDIDWLTRRIKHCQVQDKLLAAEDYEVQKNILEEELNQLIRERDGVQSSN